MLIALLHIFTALHGGNSSTTKEITVALELTRRNFPEADTLVARSVMINDSVASVVRQASGTRWLTDSMTIIFALKRTELIGLSVIDDVKGKDQLITYLVVLTPAFVVRDIEVLAYREPYGGEVANKSWQKQFHGKKPGDVLRPGREIRNISGATISARSITYGVKRVLSTIKFLGSDIVASPEAAR